MFQEVIGLRQAAAIKLIMEATFVKSFKSILKEAKSEAI